MTQYLNQIDPFITRTYNTLVEAAAERPYNPLVQGLIEVQRTLSNDLKNELYSTQLNANNIEQQLGLTSIPVQPPIPIPSGSSLTRFHILPVSF